ncbi:hypothetical protein [Bosea sp. PAMC 26642]|uniref:hypothetical protein n=1 Tax=Bosea sp. (strain PAMC 26642) TaxID=1792307 RepID=UPI0012E78325|nr:hypothetical protein [Bosea sp. PAMC 26642]
MRSFAACEFGIPRRDSFRTRTSERENQKAQEKQKSAAQHMVRAELFKRVLLLQRDGKRLA